MLVVRAILISTWWCIRNGARDVSFAPHTIGVFYIVAGALSVLHAGVAFFWLFVALGVLLIATSLILHKSAKA